MASVFPSSLASLLLSLAEPGVLRALLANQALPERSTELIHLAKICGPIMCGNAMKGTQVSFWIQDKCLSTYMPRQALR